MQWQRFTLGGGCVATAAVCGTLPCPALPCPAASQGTVADPELGAEEAEAPHIFAYYGRGVPENRQLIRRTTDLKGYRNSD
ncbi:hypothetical protein E2C01_044544 [Portunus trituberculatus]|uniref:Uncharacterized protein n=1 Tax=Portunus trituberculatus TaxID=210409 RepID=A0A5B7FZI2_PORTR|nr:hypothetical protein [Portunus trituberculatus]